MSDAATSTDAPVGQALHKGDRTVSITVGTNWAGVWVSGRGNLRRVSLGWIAFTFYRGDFDDLMRAWLDVQV